jgi:hypothetical protein
VPDPAVSRIRAFKKIPGVQAVLFASETGGRAKSVLRPRPLIFLGPQYLWGVCVPKTLNPTIVVMKSAQDGA